jgi:formylglycine-generating enzyme required for sulfatase activity
MGFANGVRQGAPTVKDAYARIEGERARQIVALRDAGVAELVTPLGLKSAREKLAAALRIALPGDTVAADLRQRIDLATHYGLFRPGQAFTDALADGGRTPTMVVVPHGGFRMGAEENEPGAAEAEQPAHYVRFDRGFAVSRNPVTVGEFRRFVQATNYRARATRRGHSIVYDERSGNFVRRSGVDWQSGYTGQKAIDDMPVLHVSVRDAEAYADWLAQQTGHAYRLASEAEFEYILRAGVQGRYPWGNENPPPKGVANLTGGNDVSPSGRHWANAFVGYGDGWWGPAPVRTFKPNAWGLYDLGGNVSEWVADCWHASFRRAPADGAAWFNPGCRARVVRGGAWASSPQQARAAWRSSQDSDVTSARVGFRVVRGI